MLMGKQLKLLMPALSALKDEFMHTKPLAGFVVLIHMHLTSETVALGEVLGVGGSQVVYLPSNRNPSAPTVVQMAKDQGSVVVEEFTQVDNLAIVATAPKRSLLVVEGNGKIFRSLHKKPPEFDFCKLVLGISEHTSGGGHLVDAFDPKLLQVPIVAVYRSRLKAILETGWGTSQTVAAALLRGLEKPIAGQKVTIVGYGYAGRGIARMLSALGAIITVVEVKMESRLQAQLEGFHTKSLGEALMSADICVTTTGTKSVITAETLEDAKEGLVLANVSDQPIEIDLPGFQNEGFAYENIRVWRSPSHKDFFVLAGGLQINHVIEKGNPAELMDISFSLHALSLRWMAEEKPKPGVYSVPFELKEKAAKLVMEGIK